MKRLFYLPETITPRMEEATREWWERICGDPADCYLYRYFDAAGRLLYVGVTKDLETRDTEHRNKAAWYGDVARRTQEGPMSRQIALLGEVVAIEEEGPRHNVYRRNGYAGPGSHIWWERASELSENDPIETPRGVEEAFASTGDAS